MQNSEFKTVFSSSACPALARHSRGRRAQAAESQAAVDAVIEGLIGDFDRVPLDSDSSDISNGVSNGVSTPSEQGSHARESSAENAEAFHISEAEPWSCEATWRPSRSYGSTVLSVRAGVGCVSFHDGRIVPMERVPMAAEQSCPEYAENIRPQLFPNSTYARDTELSCRVSALLCAARLHDDVFGTKVLDPAFDMSSQKPQLGQQPPKTAGGQTLTKALDSLQIHTELLTLQHAVADTREWTARSELFCLEDDAKIFQPITQHLGSCWSGKQVVDAVLFVVREFPLTFVAHLSAVAQDSATRETLQQQLSSEHSQHFFASISKMCDHIEQGQSDSAVRLLSELSCDLEHKRALMRPFERAAKAVLETELLLHALKMCNTQQEVVECMTNFRWYCGYQPLALNWIKGRRRAFRDFLGHILLQLADCESQHTAHDVAARVLRVAGVVHALTERSNPEEQDMHPDIEAHLLRYIIKASPNLLIRLAAQAGTRGSVFSTMPFALVNKIALALKRAKWRWKGTETLETATRVLATRLAHRIRYQFKRSTAVQIAEATQAVCYVLALEETDCVSPEVLELVSTFQMHFVRTSPEKTNCITPMLLLNLVRSLTARRLSMLREMSSKVEQLLQQQISLSISSEVLRRRKHMMHASGSEDMIPVDTVSQQVSNALNEVPGVPHDQQSCSPVSSQQSKNQYDESLSAQFVRSPNNVTWMKRNRSSAKHAALLACECLHSGILSSTSLHQLVRSMVQHRLDGCIGWGLINRCLRLANKRGLGGPKGFKSLREYRGCLELLVNVHACEGGALHTNMEEQLSALNALLMERVVSIPLTSAAAASVCKCFAQPHVTFQDGIRVYPEILRATREGCSQALVPALLLQALSRAFDRRTGKQEIGKAEQFLARIKLLNPAHLDGYMQSVIRITSPADVKYSPEAQRIRAAMISAASNIIPLYDCFDDRLQMAPQSEERKALTSSIQVIFFGMFGAVKHMVRQSTQSQQLSDPGSTKSQPQLLQASSQLNIPSSSDADATEISVTQSRESVAHSARQDSREGDKSNSWQATSKENVSVYYCLGPLWPLVQLALADKTFKVKRGTITTMSVLRAALPLVLKNRNLRHITPIVTCMQRYQYQNIALYDHVMELISEAYYRISTAHYRAKKVGDANNLTAESADGSVQQMSPQRNPSTLQHLPPSFGSKDKMQKMHVWLVSRALRSSYLPGSHIVEIMAERVERLSDRRVHMSFVERYVAMYLDGLPASKDTLKALQTAFWQRKQSWRDFAVASALQLFAERNFRSPAFETEAVEWFERQATKKVWLRPSLIGALSQTRQLWLLHGHHSFPQYSVELQHAIRKMPLNTTPSPVQLEIFKAVSGVFPSAALEQPACDGQLSVDIALHLRPLGSNSEQDTVKVAIECDGPHHFFINTTSHAQTLKTKLRNSMLEFDGWKVVLLDTYTWYSTTWHPDSATRKEVRHHFVLDLLRKNGLEELLPPQIVE